MKIILHARYNDLVDHIDAPAPEVLEFLETHALATTMQAPVEWPTVVNDRLRAPAARPEAFGAFGKPQSHVSPGAPVPPAVRMPMLWEAEAPLPPPQWWAPQAPQTVDVQEDTRRWNFRFLSNDDPTAGVVWKGGFPRQGEDRIQAFLEGRLAAIGFSDPEVLATCQPHGRLQQLGEQVNIAAAIKAAEALLGYAAKAEAVEAPDVSVDDLDAVIFEACVAEVEFRRELANPGLVPQPPTSAEALKAMDDERAAAASRLRVAIARLEGSKLQKLVTPYGGFVRYVHHVLRELDVDPVFQNAADRALAVACGLAAAASVALQFPVLQAVMERDTYSPRDSNVPPTLPTLAPVGTSVFNVSTSGVSGAGVTPPKPGGLVDPVLQTLGKTT